MKFLGLQAIIYLRRSSQTLQKNMKNPKTIWRWNLEVFYFSVSPVGLARALRRWLLARVLSGSPRREDGWHMARCGDGYRSIELEPFYLLRCGLPQFTSDRYPLKNQIDSIVLIWHRFQLVNCLQYAPVVAWFPSGCVLSCQHAVCSLEGLFWNGVVLTLKSKTETLLERGLLLPSL